MQGLRTCVGGLGLKGGLIVLYISVRRRGLRHGWNGRRSGTMKSPKTDGCISAKKNGILQVSEEDPATIVRRLLSVGPRTKGDIDKALLEEAGIKYNKANELRKTLVAKGEIAYDLMEDNKTRMYRMVDDVK